MKPGAGDFNMFDIGVRPKDRNDFRRQGARIGAQRFGQHHRRIGRYIAVAGIARRLHADARETDLLPALRHAWQRLKHIYNTTSEVFEKIHFYIQKDFFATAVSGGRPAGIVAD